MRHKGFSLIECTIYCFLFAVLVTMVFTWATRMQMLVVQKNNAGSSLMSAHAAQDLFARDVSMAYAQSTSWKKRAEQELIWHTRDVDVGWIFDQGKLFRIEGVYATSTQSWVKKSKSLIADHLTKVTFACNVGARYEVVSVQSVIDDIQRVITIKNRELV